MFMDAFKDYIDYLHSLSSLLTGDLTFLALIKALSVYVIKSVGVLFWYIISFKWLVGFTEIPALFKQNYFAILDTKSIFDMRFELEADRGFFTFLETGRLNSNNLGTGFLNSFFLTIPLSVPHLLTMRALLVNGVPAGVFSALGTLVGQFFFFVCVLFGFEFVLLPWVSIQPIIVVMGSLLVINLIFRMVHNPPLKEVGVSQRKTLFKYFRITLFLSWMEQICVYSYFGNLTVNGTATVFQTSDTNFLFSTFGYLIGLTVGSVFWTVFWGFGCIFLRNVLYERIITNISNLRLTERIHQVFLVCLTTLCLASYPYYGFDYLAGGSVGFVGEDQAFEKQRQVFFSDDIDGKLAAKKSKPKSDRTTKSEEEAPFDIFVGDPLTKTIPVIEDCEDEAYSYLPEKRWANVEMERTRVTSETSKRQLRKYNFPKEVKAFFVRDYDSLRLETSAEREEKEKEKERERDERDGEQNESEAKNSEDKKDREFSPFQQIIDDCFFRPDIYVGYKDVTHNEYGPPVQVIRDFRDLYFSNPVYKSLLYLDMYPFLLGANPEHRVSIQDEYDLYKSRLMIQGYSNSILKYKSAKTKAEVGFANRVYNQQFKGSLNVIRQFNFAKIHENIDRDPDSEFYNEERNKQLNNLKVLKYDQLLYNYFPDKTRLTLHEEIELTDVEPEAFNEGNEPVGKGADQKEDKKGTNSVVRRLKETSASPLYIGWDGSLRKFLVKTNVVPTQMVPGDTVYADPDAIYDGEGELITNPENEKLKKGKMTKTKIIPDYYRFQAWSPASENPKLSSTILNVSTLALNKQELNDLKIALNLVDEVEKVDVLEEVPALTEKQKEERNDLLSRLPHYNWFWKKIEPDYVMGGYLELGNTTPPQLDGFAWPGIRDPIMKKNIQQKQKFDQSQYRLD